MGHRVNWVREKTSHTQIDIACLDKVPFLSCGLFLLMSFYNHPVLCHCQHPTYVLLRLVQWPLNRFQICHLLTSREFRKSKDSPTVTLFVSSFSFPVSADCSLTTSLPSHIFNFCHLLSETVSSVTGNSVLL